MNPSKNFQDYTLAGKGAYSLQLDQISLVGGYDSTFVGLNAGTRIPASNESCQRNTAVGANSMVSSQSVSNTTVVGAYSGAELQNAESSTSVGTGSVQYGANIL
jgi:hypothetical protein